MVVTSEQAPEIRLSTWTRLTTELAFTWHKFGASALACSSAEPVEEMCRGGEPGRRFTEAASFWLESGAGLAEHFLGHLGPIPRLRQRPDSLLPRRQGQGSRIDAIKVGTEPEAVGRWDHVNFHFWMELRRWRPYYGLRLLLPALAAVALVLGALAQTPADAPRALALLLGALLLQTLALRLFIVGVPLSTSSTPYIRYPNSAVPTPSLLLYNLAHSSQVQRGEPSLDVLGHLSRPRNAGLAWGVQHDRDRPPFVLPPRPR